MLMAIESSCMEAPQSGLTQTDAAIVGRNRGVGPNVERRARKLREEDFVLKNSAGQYHGVDSGGAAKQHERVADAGGNPAVESARDLFPRPAAAAIFNHSGQQWTKVEFFSANRERVCVAGGGGGGEVLQPHRRLTFERDLAREAEQ